MSPISFQTAPCSTAGIAAYAARRNRTAGHPPDRLNCMPARARDTLRAASTRVMRCAAPVYATRPATRFRRAVNRDAPPYVGPSCAAHHAVFTAADRRADATPDDAAPLTPIRHAALVERARAA
ncbi:hypothetical protein [Burkholderia stagnalis]|uniref:hypothetical protein n=1 Tax=Burkholderia stagnalis TaxID=1503054 RepID=UPI0012D99F21|nr:hypothetical protein [Burkholderia stagnalis]